ncbi:MAG: hypothetical protein AAGA42_02395 [Actinomycetota bacterium]
MPRLTDTEFLIAAAVVVALFVFVVWVTSPARRRGVPWHKRPPS